ncbi:MAG: ATP synthase subunit I [Burkholderiales bacterium]|nr:ATP synthase subunit I [Burkholderiales bacterium]
MNEPLSLAFALAAGLLLGAMFYGGLWWTVRRGVSSRRPALLFLGSVLLRMGLALAGLYFVAAGHWQRLLLCLLGFVLARIVVLWLTRPPEENPPTRPLEESHAP